MRQTETSKLPVVDTKVVPASTVHPCPWNPNQQDARTYEAERESIREYGFVEPITVRPHPTLNGSLVGTGGDGWSETEWQIVNGEHRHRAAIDEGYDVVSINTLGEIGDEKAMKLTVILNETHGDADVALLGKLLADIDVLLEGDKGLLRLALPYSENELNHLLEVGKVDWDAFTQEQEEVVLKRSSRKFTVFLDFDESQRQRYDTFMEILARELGDAFAVEEAVLSALSGSCQKL